MTRWSVESYRRKSQKFLKKFYLNESVIQMEYLVHSGLQGRLQIRASSAAAANDS